MAGHEKRTGKLAWRKPADPPPNSLAGVVGLGLMGTSIAACLLIAGNRVHGVEKDAGRRLTVRRRLRSLLESASREDLVAVPVALLLSRFKVSESYSVLADSTFVVESTVEDPSVKRQVIAELEAVLSPQALIGSNTSAIPVTELQRKARYPGRVVGLHWAEPAHITRFMEIVQGEQTSPDCADHAMKLARNWGKEPSLVRKDIRGFITNRIFYAMLREAFHLVESGVATVEDVDRSMRNDLGYWITFAGPFRFMDLTGIPAYEMVMRELTPDLYIGTEVPELMKRTVARGAKGTANADGFHSYTAASAKKWEKDFLAFSYEVRQLAERYSTHPGSPPRSNRSVQKASPCNKGSRSYLGRRSSA